MCAFLASFTPSLVVFRMEGAIFAEVWGFGPLVGLKRWVMSLAESEA